MLSHWFSLHQPLSLFISKADISLPTHKTSFLPSTCDDTSILDRLVTYNRSWCWDDWGYTMVYVRSKEWLQHAAFKIPWNHELDKIKYRHQSAWLVTWDPLSQETSYNPLLCTTHKVSKVSLVLKFDMLGLAAFFSDSHLFIHHLRSQKAFFFFCLSLLRCY